MFKKKNSQEPKILLPDGVREKIEAKKQIDALNAIVRDLRTNILVMSIALLVIFGFDYIIRNQFSEISPQIINLTITIISIVGTFASIISGALIYRRHRFISEKFAISKLKDTHQEIFNEIRKNTISLLKR